MDDCHTNKHYSDYPRQSDFMIGRPENDRHPLDAVKDEDLRKALKAAGLDNQESDRVIALKDKYRDLLLQLVRAGNNGNNNGAAILADTLAVGMGLKDPRKNNGDTDKGANEIPSYAERPWFNG